MNFRGSKSSPLAWARASWPIKTPVTTRSAGFHRGLPIRSQPASRAEEGNRLGEAAARRQQVEARLARGVFRERSGSLGVPGSPLGVDHFEVGGRAGPIGDVRKPK